MMGDQTGLNFTRFEHLDPKVGKKLSMSLS